MPLENVDTEAIISFALRLHELGFNVILVDRSKRPVVSKERLKQLKVPEGGRGWSPQERIPLEEEVRELEREAEEGLGDGLRRVSGAALVAGPENPWKPTYILMIVDVDDPDLPERCPTLKRVMEGTLAWLTGIRCPKCGAKYGEGREGREGVEALELGKSFRCGRCNIEFGVGEAKRGKAMAILVEADVAKGRRLESTKRRKEKGYEVMIRNYELIPPSLHPSGVRYEWINPPRWDDPCLGIRKVGEGELEDLLRELEGPEPRPEGAERGWRKLGEDKVKKIADLLAKYYERNHRDLIVFSLLGALIKAGIDYESSKRVVELLATMANDEEIEQRLYLVDWHYGRRADAVGVGKLKGVSGLREELEAVLRGRGLDEDEVAKEVSETIAELYSILGLGRAPHAAWLKRRGDAVLEWAYAGRQGIYVFKRASKAEEPTVQRVSNAVIERVRGVKILGLNVRGLYKVEAGGGAFVGTVGEAASYIEELYGLDRRLKYAVESLIQSMAEEEELFYSPGPWVVEGRLAFAEEPGYAPPWKEYVTWRPPGGGVNSGARVKALVKALLAIKALVESYRGPGKASAVLSYGAVSPLAHYVKARLGVAFHMIVHGLEDVGKSVLLELLKLLFSIYWDDPYPGSDYQARRCLAVSTLPAIIDDIGDLMEGYVEGRRDAVAAIDTLHRAATQLLLRVSGGGSQYAGHYLAVRVVIAATNADVSLVPWQLDKFILVEISNDERIDVERARGCTPRTMDGEARTGLRYVGAELLRELEGLIPEVEGLKPLPREEIRRRLVEIGYRAWASLYKRYGFDPFLPPSPPETQLEKGALRGQYVDAFKSYVAMAERGRLKEVALRTFVGLEDPEGASGALRALEEDGAIIVAEGGKREILCKTAFLTRFGSYVAREYGLPRMGWRRLAEILGLRKTSRSMGGRKVDNLLALEFEY